MTAVQVHPILFTENLDSSDFPAGRSPSSSPQPSDPPLLPPNSWNDQPVTQAGHMRTRYVPIHDPSSHCLRRPDVSTAYSSPVRPAAHAKSSVTALNPCVKIALRKNSPQVRVIAICYRQTSRTSSPMVYAYMTDCRSVVVLIAFLVQGSGRNRGLTTLVQGAHPVADPLPTQEHAGL